MALYDGARQGCTQFLNDNGRSFRHITDSVERLNKRLTRSDLTEWVRKDSLASIEAIEAFQTHYNKTGLSKFDCREVTGRQPYIDEWPTRISVSLDLTVHRPTRGERDKVGGVILFFAKGEDKDNKRFERLKTAANLIFVFASRFLTHHGDADKKLCFAVDVFGRRIVQPTGEFLRGTKLIAESCEEIADRWSAIAPPADYDGPEWQ